MICHYAALQFSIMSSSSAGFSICHGIGQGQVPPEEVQGHFPGIGDSIPTRRINFKLNSTWEGGLKLQILMYFMVDQSFVIVPCKQWIFIQSSSYWRFDLLERVWFRIAKSLSSCLTWALKIQCLIFLKLTPIPSAVKIHIYFLNFFLWLYLSYFLLGVDVHLDDVCYVLLVLLVPHSWRVWVPYSICCQVPMPFGLHCMTSVRDWGNTPGWFLVICLSWQLWEYIKLL